MAIYAKAVSGRDVLNGAAVVGSPGGTGSGAAPYVYENDDRNVRLANLDSLKLATTLDARYHVHGLGGSGSWEH